MKSIIRLTAVAALVSMTAGCISINGEHIDTSDWREDQQHNRDAISRLELGLSLDAVRDSLGMPSDSEAFLDGDDEIRVLFYRSKRTHADGETTRDELTPVVFRNDLLVGWGDGVYETLR